MVHVERLIFRLAHGQHLVTHNADSGSITALSRCGAIGIERTRGTNAVHAVQAIPDRQLQVVKPRAVLQPDNSHHGIVVRHEQGAARVGDYCRQ